MSPDGKSVVWHAATVDRAARWERHGFAGATIWLTGLSGSGKSTLATRRAYTLKHTTRSVRAMITNVHHRLDVDELGQPRNADTLKLNEIGLVTVKTTEPIFIDDYRRNRSTGSFVLIDEATHQTVAAGMIRV